MEYSDNSGINTSSNTSLNNVINYLVAYQYVGGKAVPDRQSVTLKVMKLLANTSYDRALVPTVGLLLPSSGGLPA